MAKKENKRPQYIEDAGWFKSEVISQLSNLGYESNSEQLRKYEGQGLFKPVILENKYRVYTAKVCEEIERVYHLKAIGFSIKNIKEFVNLERSIKEDKVVMTVEDKGGYMLKVNPEIDKKDIKYVRFTKKIERYSIICDEIRARSVKLQKTLNGAKEKIIENKEAVQAIIKKR